MTTVIKIPLKDVTPAFIRDLQAKYPLAVLRVETGEISDMTEEMFWNIIAQFNWKAEDNQAILAPAAQTLSKYSIENIHAFHDILAEKLYLLDGERFASQLGDNRYDPKGENHFSVDNFLYARCFVVAQGRDFYDKVLKDPTAMPAGDTFEALLYLPDTAYELRTGEEDYDYHPDTWYETFSNPVGWPGITPLKDRLLNL